MTPFSGSPLRLPDLTPSTPIETAVRDLSAGLQTILDHSPAAVFVKRVPDWRYLLVNRTFERAFDIDRKDIIGRRDEDFLPPDIVAGVRVLDEKVLALGEALSAEEPVLHADGSRHTYYTTKFPLRNVNGGIYAVCGMATDITERKRAELLLNSILRGTASGTGERFLRSLVLELSRALGVRWAFVGRLCDPRRDHVRTVAVADSGRIVDDFEYDLGGTPCAGVIGRSICEFRSKVAAQFPEDRLLSDMGVEAYLGIPMRAADGSPLGLVVALHDAPLPPLLLSQEILAIFAARAGAEIQRLDSEARWKTLVESAPQIILTVDGEGRILFINRGLSREAPGALAGRSICDFTTPEGAAELRGVLRQVFGGGQARPLTLQLPDPEGAPGIFEIHVGPIREGAGIREAILIAVNVTGRKRLEEQLSQSQKMDAIGRLAGGVAHDFNNLLTVIQGHLSLQQGAMKADDPLRHHGEAALFAAQRAAELTQQLLTFSRKSIQKAVVLDLNAVLKDQVPMLRRLIGEHIALDVRPSAEPCRVTCDPAQLQQVILNLAVNARDAMPAGGTLGIRTRRGAGEGAAVVELEVEDTGAGIAPEILPRIFEPFFTTKELQRGTGLGLAIVHGVVEKAGGTVGVRSRVGEGTTFTLRFPQAEGRAEGARAGAEHVRPKGGECILVVEDEEVVRKLTRVILGQQDYRVLEAADGEEALRILERTEQPIALLLTDIVMPGMSGRQLAERALALRPGLPILFVTGYTDDVIVHHGVLSSELDLLEKPYLPPVLLQRVREILDRPVPGRPGGC